MKHENIDLCDVIVLAIPPSKIDNLEKLKDLSVLYSDKRFIFVSSTSVYGDQGDVDEDTKPQPESVNGKFLLECESYFKKNQSVIIRSAGQYGGDRAPWLLLSGKSKEVGRNEVINLVDRESLINLIRDTIETFKAPIINVVNENHPLKVDFYKEKCLQLQIEPPEISVSEKLEYKSVNTKYPFYKVSKAI